jgi:ribonuclease E
MRKRIIVNAQYQDEKRIAIMEGEKLIDFYVEVASREHLKGNIYKGAVTRVEPSIQAVFVDFGQKRPGFLQRKDLDPEYFKDKQNKKKRHIQDVLSKGQELIVQVEQDQRGTKGARLTTFISLPGRYIVMMPGQEKIGISRKIECGRDRDRLKQAFNKLKLPKKTGFILRTACTEHEGKELQNDLKYLTKLWNKIKKEAKKAQAPALVYREQDITVRTVRDYLASDVSEVFVDDAEACRGMRAFLRKTEPWRKINIKYYKHKKPIFSKFEIEEQIAKLSDKYVHLPSKGYLVIDRTEAVTAIDVNSGRTKKGESVEAMAFSMNSEAAVEIARQLRLRDIGGLIIIDFIDMASSKNRHDVKKKLEDELSSDKANTDITDISKFGILELSRERMRPAYSDSVHRECAVCGGTGIVRSDEYIALSALRDIRNRASKKKLEQITCRLPVGSVNYIMNNKRDDLTEIEKEFQVAVSILADGTVLPGTITVEETPAPAAMKQKQKS